MKDLFDLKNTRYDLQSKQLLKLPETSTSRYGTEVLWYTTTCSCKLCL